MNDYESSLVVNNYKYRSPYHPQFMHKLMNLAQLYHRSTPIDLLCGQGQIAKYLSMRCKEVYATDASKKMLETAPQKNNIKYILGDVNHKNFIGLFGHQQFSHCFIGRAIHWINSDSLNKIRTSILKKQSFCTTISGGFSKKNPWLTTYNQILDSFASKNYYSDSIAKNRIENCGFIFDQSLQANFQMKLSIEHLYWQALSYGSRANKLKLNETKIKSTLKKALSPYLDANNIILVDVSNTGIIFRANSGA